MTCEKPETRAGKLAAFRWPLTLCIRRQPFDFPIVYIRMYIYNLYIYKYILYHYIPRPRAHNKIVASVVSGACVITALTDLDPAPPHNYRHNRMTTTTGGIYFTRRPTVHTMSITTALHHLMNVHTIYTAG